MNSPSNDEIFARHAGRPAPLLPVLHDFHDRDGYLSEEALRAVGKALRIPIADLFGTVTFYHHFSREPGGLQGARVCTGPVCKLRGADALLDSIEGAVPMPCSGRCDDPVPVLRAHDTFVAGVDGSLEQRESPRPPSAPDGVTECVFHSIREADNATLDGYRSHGGFQGLEKALGMSPADVIGVIKESGLAGRGGAGFPTAIKWQAVSDAPGEPKSIVCNADEGEPGCFKDRALMDHDPFAVIEGMVIAGYATGANRGFIYLRYEYPETMQVLSDAIRAAEDAGLLGADIQGSGFDFELVVIRGAGAYICGEETSLLNSMEGKHPFPRNRPPYPVTHGFEDKPTAVNNVETLASVPHILREGAEWYAGLGIGEHNGTKVISLSGDVVRPGNYEVPIGTPLMDVINDWAGGVPDGRSVQAVTMAGLSGGFLAGDDLEVTLDEPCIRSKGSFLGAGGIMVFDDSRDMVSIAHMAMEFFAHESCGKCFPCRIGTQRLTERLAGDAGPKELRAWLDEVNDAGAAMKETSACGLGMAAPLITESLVKYFPEAVSEHVEG